MNNFHTVFSSQDSSSSYFGVGFELTEILKYSKTILLCNSLQEVNFVLEAIK
jgi:hypothetical protein